MSTLEIISFTMTKEEKEKIIEALKRELSKEKNILFAFLYGSFTEEGAFRDIDIGIFVENEEHFPPTHELYLEDRLSKALNVPFPIEIRVINKAPVTFLYHVITGKLLVCNDEEALTDFVTIVARKYHDIQPILEHYTREAFSEAGE